MLQVFSIQPARQDDAMYIWFHVTYCLKIRYLPFIHSRDSSSWQVLYSCYFNILVFLGFTYTYHIAFIPFRFYIMLIISYKLLLLLSLLHWF